MTPGYLPSVQQKSIFKTHNMNRYGEQTLGKDLEPLKKSPGSYMSKSLKRDRHGVLRLSEKSNRSSQIEELMEARDYTTTNQRMHHALPIPDNRAFAANYKKKTPLSEFSDALFSGGVYLNPPVQGL